MCGNGVVEVVGPHIFLPFLAILAIERLFELRLSRRNERRMKAMGGFEYAHRQFLFMVAVHALWFVSMVVEGSLAPTPLPKGLTILAGICFAVGQGLRYAAITTLGPRWSQASRKFVLLPPERIMAYPDGQPGFYFVRMRYADNVDAVFAAERQARQALKEDGATLDGGQRRAIDKEIPGGHANPFIARLVQGRRQIEVADFILG